MKHDTHIRGLALPNVLASSQVLIRVDEFDGGRYGWPKDYDLGGGYMAIFDVVAADPIMSTNGGETDNTINIRVVGERDRNLGAISILAKPFRDGNEHEEVPFSFPYYNAANNSAVAADDGSPTVAQFNSIFSFPSVRDSQHPLPSLFVLTFLFYGANPEADNMPYDLTSCVVDDRDIADVRFDVFSSRKFPGENGSACNPVPIFANVEVLGARCEYFASSEFCPSVSP